MLKVQTRPSNRSFDDFARRVNRIPSMDDNELQRLLRAFRSGDSGTVEPLLRGNLRLLVIVVRKYFMTSGTDPFDLVGEGISGLMRAFKEYDPARGATFATFAHMQIRQSILEFLDAFQPFFRMPKSASKKKHVFQKTRERLDQHLERYATPEEVTRHLGWERMGWTVDDVLRLLDQSRVDFDEQSEVGGHELDRARELQTPPWFVDDLERRELRQKLDAAIAVIEKEDPRQAIFIRHYYGVGEPVDLLMEPIAEYLRLSESATYYLSNRAIRRLRELIPDELKLYLS